MSAGTLKNVCSAYVLFVILLSAVHLCEIQAKSQHSISSSLQTMKLPRPRSVFLFSGQLRFLRARRNSGLINTHGLPALPTELLVEILSHASRIPIPFPNGGPPDVECLERRTMLLTLSRVCRCLRAVLLPILWERIEACTPRVAKSSYFDYYSPTRDKYVTKTLMRQLRTINASPFSRFSRQVCNRTMIRPVLSFLTHLGPSMY